MNTSTAAERRTVRAAGRVSVAVVVSRLLGLVREVVLAHLFPAAGTLDAFNAAFRIPNLLRDMLGEGALSKSVVTALVEVEERQGRDEALRAASAITNALFLGSLLMAVLGVVFAPQLVGFLFPGGGFDGGDDKRGMTVLLTRLMFGFVPLLTLAAAAMGVLGARNRFVVPALSSASFNLVSIVTAVAGVFVCPMFGVDPVLGAAGGVLAGGVAQWAVQLPQLRGIGFRWRTVTGFGEAWVRRVALSTVPAALAVAAVQLNVLVASGFASLGAGWLSWLTVAFRMVYLPVGVVGVAVSTANLPALARLASRGERVEFTSALTSALRLVLVLALPASVGLAVLAHPIVDLIYQHGAFTTHDASMAASMLIYLAAGTWAFAALKVVTDGFLALGDTRTPLVVTIAGVCANALLCWLLVVRLGWEERGLAVALAATAGLAFLLLAGLLIRSGELAAGPVLWTSVRAVVASLLMGAVCWVVRDGLEVVVDPTRAWGRVVLVAAGVAVGLVVYGLLAHAFGLVREVASPGIGTKKPQ